MKSLLKCYVLHISAIPKFLKQLDDVTVTEYNDATFACQTNVTDLPVSWYVDDQEVMDCDKFGIFNQDGVHKLTIKQCVKRDDGKVYVIIGKLQTTARMRVTCEKMHCISLKSV